MEGPLDATEFKSNTLCIVFLAKTPQKGFCMEVGALALFEIVGKKLFTEAEKLVCHHKILQYFVTS